MKYTLFLVLFSSCLHKGDHVMKEKGLVVAKQYTPDTRQTVTGFGFTTGGHAVITSHNIGENQKFDIVFMCEHGVVFTISKPELYAKLSQGDSVTIDFWELKNKKGKVKDYDFVDANKIVH